MSTYCRYNEVYRYWRIECISKPYPNASGNFIFKGKTLEGAIKAAKRYCDKFTKAHYPTRKWTLEMGKVLYECDYYGRKI